MNREFKNLSFTNIKAKASGRIRIGVCAVMGNVDSWGDRIHPGAFAKTIAENIKGVRHLWNHDYSQPPIASIKELRELSKEELPAEVLVKAPDATGGLLVAREYYPGNALSEWILAAIDAGDINEMSFAYDVVKSAYTEEETGLPEMPMRHIRELTELKLYDTSDVNWGMNGATVAMGAKNFNSLPLGAVLSHLQFHQAEVKAGRRNSDSDQKLVDLIHETCVSLGANCEIKSATEETDEPKSAGEKAEAADTSSTSLSELKQRIQRLQIQNLQN